jgi:membrane peptidoglycan carboxypeptidase
VSVGGVYLSFTKDFRRLWGEGSCQGWFEAMPKELRVPVMHGMRFVGKLSFDIDISSGQLEVRNTCRLETSSCSGLSELRSKFEYVPLGTDTPVLTGPKTKGWVRYKHLSPYLIEAATTLEDPGFFQHRGFSLPSLRVVLKETAERGSFYRGGSTITQQTAKNLWLSSSKTLDRKAQEAFLTVALESCLTKEQILETYFNVIEYGPGVYGIGKAARTLFGVSPRELTQLEAFHLVRILPNPKRALPPDQGGLDQTRALLKSLVKHRGLTTETDWIE